MPFAEKTASRKSGPARKRGVQTWYPITSEHQLVNSLHVEEDNPKPIRPRTRLTNFPFYHDSWYHKK